MKKDKLTILAVCGSGLVSSAMIAQKVEKVLAPLNVDVDVIGLLPTSVDNYLQNNAVDFIVTTSPIPGEIRLPVIQAVALLTGFNEEAVLAEILQTARAILSGD
jgi:PTS system galactitol-specific IIB component